MTNRDACVKQRLVCASCSERLTELGISFAPPSADTKLWMGGFHNCRWAPLSEIAHDPHDAFVQITNMPAEYTLRSIWRNDRTYMLKRGKTTLIHFFVKAAGCRYSTYCVVIPEEKLTDARGPDDELSFWGSVKRQTGDDIKENDEIPDGETWSVFMRDINFCAEFKSIDATIAPDPHEDGRTDRTYLRYTWPEQKACNATVYVSRASADAACIIFHRVEWSRYIDV